MLRVVSWNVLADASVRHDNYPHILSAVFDAATRRRAVAERLAASAGVEVICLADLNSHWRILPSVSSTILWAALGGKPPGSPAS